MRWRMILAVPSSEPASQMMISSGCRVWSRSDRRNASMVLASLSTVVMTETVRLTISDIPVRAIHREVEVGDAIPRILSGKLRAAPPHRIS